MGKRFAVVIAAVLLAWPAAGARAEDSPPEAAKKETKLRELLTVTGSGDLGVQVVNQMLPRLARMVPEAPPSFWEEFLSELRPEDLVEMVIPIYDKYLEEEDVDAILAFYSSPAGKKLIEVQPAILAESMRAGETWGEELVREVLERARKAGLKNHS